MENQQLALGYADTKNAEQILLLEGDTELPKPIQRSFFATTSSMTADQKPEGALYMGTVQGTCAVDSLI